MGEDMADVASRRRRWFVSPLTALVVLIVAANLSGCGPTANSRAAAGGAPFAQDRQTAVLIAAMRVNLSGALETDLHSENRHGMSWGITWSPFDPGADARLLNGTPDVDVRVGLDEQDSHCRLIDLWQYCVFEVQAGHYVLASTDFALERYGRGQYQRRTKYIYSAVRTNLGVEQGGGGVYRIADSIPVSQSGAQRFEIEPGRTYYLGEYVLSTFAQLHLRFTDLDRARAALAAVRGSDARIEQPAFQKPYRLQLRTAFCPLQTWIVPKSGYGTDNPCVKD